MVVLVIASIAATFLLIEDLATGILIKQLRDAFTNMKG